MGCGGGGCTLNLGVVFDNTLSMNDHIKLSCKKSFNDVRNISTIRKFLTFNATKVIVQELVCSRIDFHNSLYYGLPQKQKVNVYALSCAHCKVHF